VLGDAVITGVEVNGLTESSVSLADGRHFEAAAVIDGRGDPGGGHLDVRFQKFVGQLVETENDAGLTEPLLMDATIAQEDGFRFMYTLPFPGRRLLIEDTRYSDTPALDHDAMRAAIAAYAASKGWRIRRVLREEEGALPVVLGGDLRAFLCARPEIPRSGIRAGLFHYTTGYSLPEAARLADDLARLRSLTSAELAPWIRARSLRLWRRGRYFRLLNRMLFLAGPAEQRYRILEHFYRLPEDLVNRFYAGALTWGDRLRIVSGKPPVPVRPALASLFGIATRPSASGPVPGGPA
jgi:lycopene beta-cyclase